MGPEEVRGSMVKGLLGAWRPRISARLARPRCGSGSRPRFNCSWMTSMAPAARGEPLGGSETRLKQLACCRHIVPRQGLGYQGRCALVPWPTRQLRAGDWHLASPGPAGRRRSGSARKSAPDARDLALRLPLCTRAVRARAGSRTLSRAPRLPFAAEPFLGAREVPIAASEISPNPSFPGAPRCALAPLPFARGRPSALRRSLTFAPGCLSQRTGFCWRQNRVNFRNYPVAEAAKRACSFLVLSQRPLVLFGNIREGSPASTSWLFSFPLSISEFLVPDAITAEGMGHRAA